MVGPQIVTTSHPMQTEKVHSALQRRLETKLNRVMDQVGERAKDELKDDYMPMFVQSIVDDSVDSMMPDIKLNVFAWGQAFKSHKKSYLVWLPIRNAAKLYQPNGTHCLHHQAALQNSQNHQLL